MYENIEAGVVSVLMLAGFWLVAWGWATAYGKWIAYCERKDKEKEKQ